MKLILHSSRSVKRGDVSVCPRLNFTHGKTFKSSKSLPSFSCLIYLFYTNLCESISVTSFSLEVTSHLVTKDFERLRPRAS